MEIKVLGTGCSGCKTLHQTVEQAVAELGIEASVIKVEDLMQIMQYNVLSMPGLVVNEKVVSAGKKLSLADIKALLTQ
ncbi:MAG: thioredoxin family protein [Bacteroidales bacterium]